MTDARGPVDDATFWRDKFTAARNRAEAAEVLIRQWADKARRSTAALRDLLAGEIGPDYARAVLDDLDKVRLDEPIADPAERARAVARELRGRGMRAHAQRGDYAGPWLVRISLSTYEVVSQAFKEKGPLAIADEIQKAEAKLAKQWAGDEET